MRITLRLTSLVLLWFLMPEKGIAQTDCPGGSPWVLDLRGHAGFTWPHRPVLKYLITDHVFGVQACLGFRTPGNRAWQRSHHNPVIGFGLHHSGLGNKDVFGKLWGVFGFIQAPLFRPEKKSGAGPKRFSINYMFGFGLGLITKPFDEVDNNTNLALGNALNAYLNLSLDLGYRFSPRWEWVNGISLTHVSNGGIKRPNLGLNLPTLFTGLRYSFSSNPRNSPILEKKTRLDTRPMKHVFSLSFATGWKEISRVNTKKYLIGSISPEYHFSLSEIIRVGGGIDLFQDPSIRAGFQEEGRQESGRVNFRAGIHGGIDLVYGRTDFLIQAGIYAWAPLNQDGPVYNRFALRQHISKTIFLGLGLKTHLAKADFIEWGVGYRFSGK